MTNQKCCHSNNKIFNLIEFILYYFLALLKVGPEMAIIISSHSASWRVDQTILAIVTMVLR